MSSYQVVRVQASAPLLARQGGMVSAGQPIGRSVFGRSYEVAPCLGTIRYIQFDAETHNLLVFILEAKSPQGSSQDNDD